SSRRRHTRSDRDWSSDVCSSDLIEEGKLSPFDPVAKFIPAFEAARVYRTGPAAAFVTAPATEPMLVWHLLTHTSGLTYGFYFTRSEERRVGKECRYRCRL